MLTFIMFDLDSEVKGKIPTSCGNQAGLQEIAVRRRARGKLSKQNLQLPRPCFPVGAVFCIPAGDFVKKLVLAAPAAVSRPRSIVFAVILVAPGLGISHAAAAEPLRETPLSSHCQLVKSAPARQACVDSLKAAADGNNLLAATLMTLILTGHQSPLYVFIIAMLMGLVRPSDLGVRGALVATVMPHDLLIGAISVSRTTMDTARIAGALSGAGLFAALGMGPAYMAIVSLYILATLLTLCVVAPFEPPLRKLDIGFLMRS